MKRFKIRAATFTPDAGEPFEIMGVKSIEPAPDDVGTLATVTLCSLDPKYLDPLKEGTTGQLVGYFADYMAPGEERLEHEYGRLKVTYCHPGGEYKGLASVTIVLVPIKD